MLPSSNTVMILVTAFVGDGGGGGGGGGTVCTIRTDRALTYPVRGTPFTLTSRSHDPRSTSTTIFVLAAMFPIGSPLGVGLITVRSIVVPFISPHHPY